MKQLHHTHLIAAISAIAQCRPQAPLQPLQDNLESQTYETFEKDGTKYATYQAAVAAALRDRVPDAEAATRTTVLMVRFGSAAAASLSTSLVSAALQ